MISIPSPSKYFKRAGSPSTEEIILAIRDIEVRLDELEGVGGIGRRVDDAFDNIYEVQRQLSNLTESVDVCKSDNVDLMEAVKELRDGKTKL